MRKPLAIDLFAGLGGWTEALLENGWDVVGFDIERHEYMMPETAQDAGGAKGTKPVEKRGWTQGCAVSLGLEGETAQARTKLSRYPAQLVLQDVCTIHGAQFKDADLIVASPPCTEFSWRAMPWKLAKAAPPPYAGMNLFWQCWRIQHEACEAAGRYIPMIVENVKGAQRWVGSAKWHYGSFYLWGDVPALMPQTRSGLKLPAGNCVERNWSDRPIQRLCDATKNNGGSWFAIGSPGQTNVGQNPDGRKTSKGGGWFSDVGEDGTRPHWKESACETRKFNSKSNARKAASAAIAKIPPPLARHIAQVFKP